MKPELIVALDVPDAEQIPRVIETLPDEVRFYKVGLELFTANGPDAFSYLKDKNRKIFLDLKLHDIPRTVARAVKSAAKHGASLLTVHAGGGNDMLKAAAESAGESSIKLIAVTVLTSLNENNLKELGINRPLNDHVLSLAEMAISCGINGLVCSPLEVKRLREKIGPEPILVTPGIRPSGSDAGDQKRLSTPSSAVKAGSNFLVVGRPILEASDPSSAARTILDEMTEAEEAIL